MRVSVIVCTHNRPLTVTKCLDAIAASIQHAGAEGEILAVDNASRDNTAQVLANWAKNCPVPIRVLNESRQGVCRARNHGMRVAKGRLLVFVDDDCYISKTHIAEAIAYDDKDKELVIRGGRVELGDPADLPLTVKTDPAPARWDKSTPMAKYTLMDGKTIIGCNFTMRPGVIEKTGFFDTRIGAGTAIPGGEDIDYFLRAFEAGIPIEYVPDMVTYHWHGRRTQEEGIKLMRSYAIATGGLYGKYLLRDASLCRELYWDIKKSFKELTGGKNELMPEMNFSYTHKTLWCLRGMARYAVLALTEKAE